MDAMILAAGLGTRLRPLTDTIPKALIDVAGVPMLERVARRLIEAGATRLVVNAHHHADAIERFVEERNGFGVETVVSNEADLLLDTGGGLKRARPFFRGNAPFLLHNADVLSDIDLAGLYRSQLESDPLATLAVMVRDTTRYLMVDDLGVCGYGSGEDRPAREAVGAVERLGFCGVHAISPRIFNLMEEEGVFSIIGVYMRLIGRGERVDAYRVDGSTWIDIGKPEQLEKGRRLYQGK